jgi:MFS family permease
MLSALDLGDASIRRLALAEFVGSFNVLMPVLALFYVHRGLRVDEVVSLILAWVITSLLSEVLTGAFADRFGSRASFLAGSIVGGLQFVALYFARGFWTFAFASALGALGFSFFSGSDQAYVYDRMQSAGRQQEFGRVWGRVQSAKIVPAIAASLLGAFLARGLSESSFVLLLAVGFAGSVLKAWLILGLEDSTAVGEAKEHLTIWGTVRTGWKQVLGSRPLMWLFLHETLLLVPTHVMLSDYNVAQPLLIESGLAVAMLGPLYTAMSLCSLAAFTWGAALLRRLGEKTFLLSTAAAMLGVWISWLGERTALSLLAGMLVLKFLLFARLVACSQLKNDLIASGSRATTLSFLATADSAFDIVLLGSLGLTARQGYDPIFYGCAVVSAFGIACGAWYLYSLKGAHRWAEPSCGT